MKGVQFQKKGELIKILIYILLSILITLVVYPLFPEIIYDASVKLHFTPVLHVPITERQDQYRLMIPDIGVNVRIVEGETDKTLQKGAWHIPGTGNPERGNMVVAGHRFEYLPPNNTTFYNLNKLQKNDSIFIQWGEQVYIYHVKRIIVVSPEDVSIENETLRPTLTLYTCTPLWTDASRLVVIAMR